MKKYLLFFSKYSQSKLKSCFITVLFLTSTFVIGQTITPTKTVIKNANSCSIIDVELKVQGANPVARPLEVVLVIDVSGSMGNTISGDSNTSMDYAKDAAVDFINTFFLPANNPTGLNKVGIVTYSSTGLLRQALTPVSGQAGLLTIINGLNASGNTNIQDGLVKADNELIAHGTYNCSTARSIILLTDGVANRTGTGGSTCTSGTGGTCIQSAITAATNAKTHTVSSVVYNNQIFSVGLFGGISGTDQTNAQFCLNNIQSGGSYFTESGANLSGIYSQIFTQLSWVAAQIVGTPFNKETVSADFNIVPGSITVSKGTFTQAGQVINWNIDFLNVETITLKYQLTPKANVCGDRIVSTTRLDYQNSSCSTAFQNVTTPNYCVPCAPLLSALPAPSTISCPATPAFTAPTVTNGCQSSNLTFVDVRTNGNCASAYSVTRTWTASNACFTANVSQTINVNDTTNPTASNPASITLTGCNGTFPAPDVSVVIDEADACSTPTVTFVSDGQPTLNGCIETTIRTYKVTDACGNFINVTQNLIRTNDTQAPIWNTQPGQLNVTIECSNANALANAQALFPSASDLCDTNVTNIIKTSGQFVASGGCTSVGTYTNTWIVTDDCGNTSALYTQVITVEDTTAPIFASESLPANATVQCDNIPEPIVLTASDNCDSQVAVIYNQSISGQDDGCASNYTITRNWSVTDCAGNNTSHTQVITVEDTTAPIFASESLPANATVQCDNVPEPIVLTASDNCDSQVAVIYNQSISGQDDGCASNYTITRSWSVTDCAGNNTSHTQVITVEDTTAPIFASESLPANATVQCDNVPEPIVLTASDNCDNQVAVIYNQSISGQDDGCASNYTITRSWSVTDCAGNNTSHTQIITVEDTTAPIFASESLPANATVQCDNIPEPLVLTASDNCDSQVAVIYNQSIVGQDDGCASNYIITRNWSVTDCAGNNTSHTQVITVEDTAAPIFASESLPASATVQCDNIPEPIVLTASDNCDSQVAVIYNQSISGQDDGCASNYIITRNWSVTDCAGNNTSHTQVITVEDTTAPIFASESLPANATVQCDNIPEPIVLTASDNCDSQVAVIYNQSISGQDDGCASNYIITRNWSVTDCAGNNTSHTQVITVEDTTAPIFASESLPANATVQCDAVPSAPVITASDNCDNQVAVAFTESINHNDENCVSNYIITRTWVAADCAGNSVSHSQTITVSDDIAPVLSTPANEVLNVSCGEIPTRPELVFTDNCTANVNVVFTENIIDETQYTYTIVRDWLASDSCGNSTAFNQTIYVTIGEPFSHIDQSLCIGDLAVDLFSYVSLTPEESQGTWVDVNNSGGLTGSTLDPANILPGFYVYRYTVEGGNCPRVIEIYMTIHDDCIVLPCNITQLNISKVVTPNNDGSNDFFKIGGLGECGFIYDIKMFNRWGDLVYESPNYQNDWDGKSQGNVSDSNLPSGSYFYIINIVNSGFDVKTGYIYLGTKN